MQIVTDSGMDLSQEQTNGLNIHSVPLQITLDGKTYKGGENLDYQTFYQMLSETQSFPTTSQPSPGEFAALYRQLAKEDPPLQETIQRYQQQERQKNTWRKFSTLVVIIITSLLCFFIYKISSK